MEIKTMVRTTIHCPNCHNTTIINGVCSNCYFQSNGYIIEQHINRDRSLYLLKMEKTLKKKVG